VSRGYGKEEFYAIGKDNRDIAYFKIEEAAAKYIEELKELDTINFNKLKEAEKSE
jgi:hypothetical protein